jgi:predicted KAP-like P-loop ATPase
VTEQSSSPKLRSDTPLDSREQDQLGYSDFAENIAETIGSRTPADQFVVGIYGEWGSGKSTILNLVENDLQSQEPEPIVIRFNPWWFSGQADLINKFFERLQAGLGSERRLLEARQRLAKLSQIVSKSSLGEISGVPVSSVAGATAEILDTEETLDDLKDNISEDLRDLEQQIVVLIDDIDRLTNEEILQMFRLIKSVADFPNIVYVLAFDEEVVSEALESGERGVPDGREYLQKIVQLPQHVPLQAEGSLSTFSTNKLSEILDSNAYYDEQRWQAVYFDSVEELIETPRDAIRLSNAVKTTYQTIGAEVNFTDLVAIESIRIHNVEIYEKIQENEERLTEESGSDSGNNVDYSDLFGSVETDNNCVQGIIEYLFPTLQNRFDGLLSGFTEDHSGYQRRRRICHPDFFRLYFRKTVPENRIRTGEFDNIRSLVSEPEQFSERLVELSDESSDSGRSKAHSFLKRFQEFTNEDVEKEGAVEGLLRRSDELAVADPSESWLDDGNKNLISSIVLDLLRGSDNPSQILSNAIQQSDSIGIPTYMIGILAQEHGELHGNEMPTDRRTLTSDELEEAKNNIVTQIENADDEQLFSKTPNLRVVLTRWLEWGHRTSAKEAVVEYSEQDTESLVALLDEFASEGHSSTQGRVRYFNPESVEPFFSPDELRSRLEEIKTDELSEEETLTLDVVREGLEIQEEGTDAGDLLNWTVRR